MAYHLFRLKIKFPLSLSNLPVDDLIAPVNAPFSNPNISASIRSFGTAAQFRVTKFPLRLLPSCKACNQLSFPEPVGPYIIAGASDDATRAIIFFNLIAACDWPIIFLSNGVK